MLVAVSGLHYYASVRLTKLILPANNISKINKPNSEQNKFDDPEANRSFENNSTYKDYCE